MKIQRLLLIALSVFTTTLVFGQQVERAQSSESVQSRFDTLRTEGYDAMYNLDYEGARRHFKEMIDLFPNHPAGRQSMAASLWLEQLNRSWELRASLYRAESYYSGKKAPVDIRRMEEFCRWTKAARQLAEARLRSDPRDTEALYFLGATEGLTAFAAATDRRFMAALTDGSRSVDRHREVLKIAPDFHDAELTIGLYSYIVGSLPLPVRVLAGTMGVRGSKKRGLETLERVAKEGRWARDVARVLLIDLYKREKRWPEALAVSRELAQKYPRNYIFKLQMADALVSQLAFLRKMKGESASPGGAEQREAFGIFDSLLREETSQRHTATPGVLALIHFRYGEALLVTGLPERAVKEFAAVSSQIDAEPGLAVVGRLRAAQSLDLAGRRSEAVAEYRNVLRSPDTYHAHEEARRGLREVYHLR